MLKQQLLFLLIIFHEACPVFSLLELAKMGVIGIVFPGSMPAPTWEEGFHFSRWNINNRGVDPRPQSLVGVFSGFIRYLRINRFPNHLMDNVIVRAENIVTLYLSNRRK